jgi:hypothetical protein
LRTGAESKLKAQLQDIHWVLWHVCMDGAPLLSQHTVLCRHHPPVPRVCASLLTPVYLNSSPDHPNTNCTCPGSGQAYPYRAQLYLHSVVHAEITSTHMHYMATENPLSLADQTGYGEVHCHMFKYYGECLTALEILNREAQCLLKVGTEIEVDHKRLIQSLQETSICVMRCWSVVRAEHGIAPFPFDKVFAMRSN